MILIHFLVMFLALIANISFGQTSNIVFVVLLMFYRTSCDIGKEFAMQRNKALTLKILFWSNVFDIVVFFFAAMVFPVYVTGKVAIGREMEKTNETMSVVDNSTTIAHTFPTADKYTFADSFSTAGNSTFADNITIDEKSTTADKSTKPFSLIYPKDLSSGPLESALIMGYLYEALFILLAICCLGRAFENYGQMKQAAHDNFQQGPLAIQNVN